jgi:hypothetical protein
VFQSWPTRVLITRAAQRAEIEMTEIREVIEIKEVIENKEETENQEEIREMLLPTPKPPTKVTSLLTGMKLPPHSTPWTSRRIF